MKPYAEINRIMQTVDLEHRYRWCGSGECYCMGCVNRMPVYTEALTLTKEEWQLWVDRNQENLDHPNNHRYTWPNLLKRSRHIRAIAVTAAGGIDHSFTATGKLEPNSTVWFE